MVKLIPPSEDLPIAMTCQNILIVPDYPNEAILEDKLYKALEMTRGHYIK